MAKIKQKVAIEYFFIWGNYPAIALAETLSAFERWGIGCRILHASVEAAVLELDQFLPQEFMDQLGGTTKIGQIISKTHSHEVDAEAIASFLATEHPKGKLFFGLSQYRLDHLAKEVSKKKIDTLGKNIKALLKDTRSVRWVTSKEQNLSTVVVTKNKLVSSGAEIVILRNAKSIWIGKTIAVQPFEAYGERDYGRAVADGKVGMIPPKLAQMMLNLSKAKTSEIILDPFCGYGTILQEALLMGWKHVVGSDLAKSSVNGTKKNLLWLKQKYQLQSSVVRIFHSDARHISEHVRGGYVSTIVTEPHLGPALRKRVSKDGAHAIKSELESLYYATFVDFTKFLRPGSRIVMVWPVFILSSVRKGLMYIELLDRVKKLGFVQEMPFEQDLKKYNMGGRSTRMTLMYGRPQQKVWREVVVFTYTGR